MNEPLPTINLVQINRDELDALIKKAAFEAIDQHEKYQSRKRLLKSTQIAARLSKSKSGAVEAMRSGRIPGAFQEGTEWKIMEYDLDTHIESLKRKYLNK
jgi:hypothetical protein